METPMRMDEIDDALLAQCEPADIEPDREWCLCHENDDTVGSRTHLFANFLHAPSGTTAPIKVSRDDDTVILYPKDSAKRTVVHGAKAAVAEFQRQVIADGIELGW
jgi:hypothetical protein